MDRSTLPGVDGGTATGSSAAGRPDDYPRVSIVVPVYEDPEGLRQTAESLTSQTYPDDAHEILLVDNDSSDETPAVARSFASANEHVETAVEADRQSSYAARNEGIRRSTGDVFAFVDADMQVPPTWLEDAVAAMERKDADYMGCDVEMIPSGEGDASRDGESLAETYNRETGFPVEQFVERLEFVPTCCLLVRRSVFEDVGLFDPRMISSGDREFGHRVRDSGREIHFAEDVTMYHPTRASVGELLRKSRRIGRGFYQLRKFHPERYAGRLPVALNPMPFVPRRYGWRLGQVDGWSDLSRRERAGFYLLTYARSVTNGLGRIEETVRSLAGRDRRPDGSVPTLGTPTSG